MSKTVTVTQLLQARLENAIRRRRENPSRSDLLMIPVLALALDACGGGGSQRPTPPPPPPPPPAATITADATATVAENAAGATIAAVTTANATSTSVDNDNFEVVGGNLKLKDGVSLDFEAADEVVVEITASGAGASATHTVTITVTDVNEAPTIEVAGGGDAASTAGGITASFTVAENSGDAVPGAAGAVLGLITLSDPDAGQTHTVTVDDDRFQVIDHAGAKWLTLKAGTSLDFEEAATVDLTLTVTDSGTPAASATADVTITVTDVNEAPTIEVAGGGDAASTAGGITASFTVAENSGDAVPGAAGAVLGLITLSDPDAGQTHTVTVDDDRFQVIDHAGAKWLTLKAGTSLDFEEAATVDLTLTVTDSGTPAASATADVTITVTDVEGVSVAAMTVPAAMAAGVNPDLAIAEDSDGSVPDGVVAHIALSDPDAGNKYDITVSDSRFEVIDAFGEKWLKLKAGQKLDHESEGTIDVTVTAALKDGSGNAVIGKATITVEDANEAPTIEVAGGGDAASTAGGITASFTVAENSGDAVPGAAGAVLGLITLSDADAGDTHTVTVDDDRFQVIDHAGAKWLTLKAGMSLDFEAENADEDPTIALTLTVTDSGTPPASATADVTITVTDVSEAPEVMQDSAGLPVMLPRRSIDTISESRGELDFDNVDLTGVFTDPEGGELTYSVRMDPRLINEADDEPFEDGDVEITVTEKDGKLTGTLSGKNGGDVSLQVEHLPGIYDVTIIATDAAGLKAEAMFELVVDDRDDRITAINLYNLADAEGNEAQNLQYEVEVNENHDGEVVFGRITVDDIDSSEHPHGRHQVTVDDDRFEIKVDDEGGLWLVLKAGNALDYEEENGQIELELTARPYTGSMQGLEQVVWRQAWVGDDGGHPLMQQVTVKIKDVNDAPEAIRNPGNWWVTVDDDLDEDNITAGQWLNFMLETADNDPNTMDYPAFKDEDSGNNGMLKYELVNSPAWLQITAAGEIQNKAKMLAPNAGTYDVTVKATDGGGLSDMFSFKLVVAFSESDNSGNDAPALSRGTVNDVTENPAAGVLVATFTVRDDDSGLTGHPFAPGMPRITNVVNDDDNGDSNNGLAGYGTAFKIERVGSTDTYRIVTTAAAEDLLDHEDVEDIQITVLVSDGVGGTDTLEIGVDIEDANEAPSKDPTYSGPGNTPVTVPEVDNSKIYLWIKLHDFWEDTDGRQDDDELAYGVTGVKGDWIKVLYEPQPWEDIEDGPDGDPGTADDIVWGQITTVTASDAITTVTASDAGSAPDDGDDYVVVIEIDRTKMNGRDGDPDGEFTLTARDEGGRTGMATVKVPITDLNQGIPASSKAVTISGTAREGEVLTANFDQTKDPDLQEGSGKGAHHLKYIWTRVAVNADGTDGDSTNVYVGGSNTYTLTQADVGSKIMVRVTYSELRPSGQLVEFAQGQSGASTVATTGVVANTRDPGKVHFNFLTDYSGTDRGIKAEVFIQDQDGVPASGETGAPVYEWQHSRNGVSGWVVAEDNGRATTVDGTTTLEETLGTGGYYRLVVTYTDNEGGRERHVSEPVRFDEQATEQVAAPTLTAQAVVVGGTLRVNIVLDDDDPGLSVGVQWQQRMGAGENTYWADIVGATGRTLLVAPEYAGGNLRALVTYRHNDEENSNFGVSQIEALYPGGGTGAIPAIANTAPNAADPSGFEIEASLNQDQVNSAKGGTVVTTIVGTVPMDELFEDLDGDMLTYSVSAGPGDNSTDVVDGTGVWFSQYDALGGIGALFFDPSTGQYRFVTQDQQGHDGNNVDGQGNIISATVTASDGRGGTSTTTVNLRLNVAPTDIDVLTTTPSIGSVLATSRAAKAITVQETKAADEDRTIAWLDVQDENDPTHEFGQHIVLVYEGDSDQVSSRFQALPIGGANTDGSRVRLVLTDGSALDYETEKTITLRLKAYDDWELDGTTLMYSLESPDVKITITVSDDPSDNPPTPPPSTPRPSGNTEVPGLDDDESGDDNDGVDDAADDDVDGGWNPPGTGMSVANPLDDGILVAEGDLLEDFTLMIDDHIDAA